MTLGIFLVIIGIIGWLIPVIPGWPALIPGLVILSDYIPPLKRVLNWAKARMEKARKPSEPPPNPTP